MEDSTEAIAQSFKTPEGRVALAQIIEQEVQREMEKFVLPSGNVLSFVDDLESGKEIACNPTIRLDDLRGITSELLRERSVKRAVDSLSRQIKRGYADAENLTVTRVKCLAADDPGHFYEEDGEEKISLPRVGWVVYVKAIKEE